MKISYPTKVLIGGSFSEPSLAHLEREWVPNISSAASCPCSLSTPLNHTKVDRVYFMHRSSEESCESESSEGEWDLSSVEFLSNPAFLCSSYRGHFTVSRDLENCSKIRKSGFHRQLPHRSRLTQRVLVNIISMSIFAFRPEEEIDIPIEDRYFWF